MSILTLGSKKEEKGNFQSKKKRRKVSNQRKKGSKEIPNQREGERKKEKKENSQPKNGRKQIEDLKMLVQRDASKGSCMDIYKDLRSNGVYVHQWWGD